MLFEYSELDSDPGFEQARKSNNSVGPPVRYLPVDFVDLASYLPAIEILLDKLSSMRIAFGIRNSLGTLMFLRLLVSALVFPCALCRFSNQ